MGRLFGSPGRRLMLAETGFAKGAYPDVTGDAIASRGDFDMVLWELNRRSRETEGGGGFSTLFDEENYPPQANYGIADFLRWGESDETDTFFGWDLFDDPDHEDWELTFAASVSGDINIFDTITFSPITGQYDIYYQVGEWGTGTVTLRATDPEGLYDEVSFDVTSVLVTDYDLEWKDQGTWVGVPSDEGILTNDELRARAIHTPIPPEFVVPISWKHKEWWDASDDVYAVDAINGNWQYPLITDQYSDGFGGTWYEFQLIEGDWGFTPEIDFGQFRYAAQLLPAKELNVYKIQDPVWEGIELSDGSTHFEPDGNPPEFGGGDRFFAERNLPQERTGSVLHDSVNLVVSLDRNVRPGWHVPVAVKLLDPDHYAIEPFDWNDDQNDVDFDWFKPRDNVKAGGQGTLEAGMGTNGTGGNLATSVDILANTLSVKTPLQVLARQPTNNFIAASFNPRISAALIDFHWLVDDRAKRLDNFADPVPQTPTLTIWRHLYIELDSMDQPDLAQAPNPSIIAAGNITYVNGVTLKIDQPIWGPAFRFQGGEITILDAANAILGTYPVAGNNTGLAPEIDLTVAVPAGAAKFINLKDDDANVDHNVTVGDMFPDVALFASRFRPACIAFDPAKDDLRATSELGVSQLGGVTFDLNTTIAELPGLHGTWRRSATEEDFWAAYLVGAFQPDETKDNDWDVEDAVIGYTSTLVGISAIFRETGRDVDTEEPNSYVIGEEDIWRVAGLHEVGHQFGLDHHPTNDGPIMHYTSMETMAVGELVFSADGLRQITWRNFPRESTPGDD